MTEVDEKTYTVSVSAQNAQYLDSYTLDCGLSNVTVKLGEAQITTGVTVSDGKVTCPLDAEGAQTITGEDAPPPVVTGITCTSAGNADSVKPGETLQFTATLEGTNTDLAEVTWTLAGAADPDTKIDASGNLTVGANETAAKLTVTAAAGGKSGSLDVTVEQEEAAPDPQPPVYEVTKGSEAQWTKNSSTGGLTFTTNADSTTVSRVEVDGNVLDSDAYTVTGTSVTLNAAYLNSLRSGEHTITIVHEDGGRAEATFRVRMLSVSASTGDNIMVAVAVLLVSAAALVIVFLVKKKKK